MTSSHDHTTEHGVPLVPQSGKDCCVCCLNFHCSFPQPQWHPVSRLEVGDLHVVHCVIVHPSLELSVCLLEEVGGGGGGGGGGEV